MTGGKRIFAVESDSHETAADEFLLTETVEAGLAPAPEPDVAWDYVEEPDAEPERWLTANRAPVIVGMLMLAWTGSFIVAKFTTASAGITLDQALGWIRDWSIPVVLICIGWLLAMRTSKREAKRFGDVSRHLAAETASLETRLVAINGELSLAREFIAAQARDLESLGRMATDRLGQSSEQLRSLIHANSAQIESIGSVSEAALNNMEKLRGQLPVIANSARDVTNNMGNAGRTAHAQLQEMINGFKRLNEFGQASERQVEMLRSQVANTIDELTTDTALMEQIASRRFTSITEQGAAFRSELESYQAQAIAALESRVQMLAGDIETQRGEIETREAVSLAALQSRIDLLREQSNAVADTLLASETTAVAGLSERLAQIDTEIASRQQRQQDLANASAKHSVAFAGQIAELEQRISDIAGHAFQAETSLTNSVKGLTERLDASKTALAGTSSDIAALTDSSVRLLELIEAGSVHSREKIPVALEEAEARLQLVENRMAALHAAATNVAGLGDQFHNQLVTSQDNMESAAAQLEMLHGLLDERNGSHSEALDRLRQLLETVDTKSADLASRAQNQLSTAIEQLTQAADGAVAGIENDSAAAILRISQRLGEESKASIDTAIEQRAAEIAGQLELAVNKASALSRAATIQLRDQLSKVDELAGNLERRVTQARERAEEQIDNDFSRRVALITEALNSNSIDIARTLETDVSDTSWNAYLKGDRGIFTRRAVKLIENSEAKAIMQVYENDDNFRGHTNRFIHDFEAMLRQVLSTRDGNALGVTLLSSDMGKLYVALAQAIERLRG